MRPRYKAQLKLLKELNLVIRKKCLDCCVFSCEEVKLCTAEDCPLHLYRFGHNLKILSKFTHKSKKNLENNAIVGVE